MNTLPRKIWNWSNGGELLGFRASECNGALWSRAPRPDGVGFYDRLLRGWKGWNGYAHAGDVRSAMARLWEALPSHASADPFCRPWIEDITLLTEAYQAEADVGRVQLTLDVERPCQRFHADNLMLRLLCAYRGPGTLWLAEDNVNLAAAEQKGSQEADFVLRADEVRSLGEWDVLVMKGRKCSGVPLYHKSPPPGPSPSLLFKIDDLTGA